MTLKFALEPSNAEDILYTQAGTPTLDLRFASSKSLVDHISGQSLVTFTRASTGTYIDSDGVIRSAANDAPRFDHNPLTGECLGLLIEEQRTNLLLQSEDFSTTWSYILSSATVNVATAPDGTLSADKLIPDNGSTLTQSGLLQDKAKIASPVTYTFSVYCKAAGFDTVRILFTDPAPGVLGRVFADYNLLDGSEITAPSATGTFSAGSGGIVDTGNGWYRVFVTALTSTETSLRVRLYARDSSATTGDGTSGIYIWGAQLEEGAFPTSYIKTEAADATRTADVASITGTNFSSWYRQDEGSAFIDFNVNGVNTGNNFIYDFSNSTSDEEIFLNYLDTGNARWAARIASVQASQDQSGAGLPRVKHAFGMASNNYMAARDGILSTGSSQVGMPSNTSLKLGARFNDSAPSNSTIRRLTYWPQRLANNVLQAITQ